MKKIIFGLMTLIAVLSVAGAGAFAYFSDVETSEDNTFTAGTLDLKVDGNDDPYVVHVNIDKIKPGDTITQIWTLKNVGTLPGILSVEFSGITNNDNLCNDPEKEAEIKEYGVANSGDGEGELGAYLRTWVIQSHLGGSDFSWGIGDYHASKCTGYLHPTRPHTGLSFGLNYLGGWKKVSPETLTAGSFKYIKLVLSLDKDIIHTNDWGTGTYDIDDNVIQSDSVEFDIIFHLDQA